MAEKNTNAIPKLLSNFELDSAQKKVLLYFNPSIFSIPEVKKTAAAFESECWITIDGDLQNEIVVELRPKQEADLELLARKFNNNLLGSVNEVSPESSPALLDRIKNVVNEFIKEQEGKISKKNLVLIGSLLASIGVSSTITTGSHLCPDPGCSGPVCGTGCSECSIMEGGLDGSIEGGVGEGGFEGGVESGSP